MCATGIGVDVLGIHRLNADFSLSVILVWIDVDVELPSSLNVIIENRLLQLGSPFVRLPTPLKEVAYCIS